MLKLRVRIMRSVQYMVRITHIFQRFSALLLPTRSVGIVWFPKFTKKREANILLHTGSLMLLFRKPFMFISILLDIEFVLRTMIKWEVTRNPRGSLYGHREVVDCCTVSHYWLLMLLRNKEKINKSVLKSLILGKPKWAAEPFTKWTEIPLNTND